MSKKSQDVNISGKTWKPDRPYDALPALPPTADVETRAVLKQCILARGAG